MVPRHLCRFPTRAAIDALVERFDLPNAPHMQDWEWEVADKDRIDEFMSAYVSGELDEDERFVLMEILLQSFDDLGDALNEDSRWQAALRLIDENMALHAHSLWYWADPEKTDPSVLRVVAPALRKLLTARRDTLSA